MTNTIVNEKDHYHMPYFKHRELACPATGEIVLAAGFADRLLELREKWGQPMVINSACRSREYNTQIGGHPRSFHIYDQPHYNTGGCCAVDVRITDSHQRGQLINLAWNKGWSIGVNKNFLHLDRRGDYTELRQIVFLY